MNLADESVIELSRRIKDGEVTSVEVTQACIARINEKESEINAWIHFDPEFALTQAAKCDQLSASGQPTGPLHGIPVGVKDIFDTADFPTENGTVLDKGRQPMDDCAVVSKLKSAGAVIMGKTVSTEMAVYSPGKTANPHDIERTPGGSSSGSAAAVACGMVPLAIGSQTNGSVIRPASFCGVVGFKPTHGKISRAGALALSRNLDHVGVFARSLEDAALLADCLIGFDPKDPDTQSKADPKLYEVMVQEAPVEPKFAFIKTPVWNQAEQATQEAFQELAEFLGDACDVIDMPDIFNSAVGNLRKIMTADLAKYLSRYTERGRDQISDILLGMIDEGAEVSAVDYNTSVDQRSVMNSWLKEISEEYDAIVTPATIGEAPKGLDATGDPVFCSTWSYLGVPAVTLPLLEGENAMPVGVQLISIQEDDGRLLRTARWLAKKVAS